MAFPTYTQADLASRVLARLVEVGVSSAAGSSGGFVAGAYTQAQVIDRALARVGEIGFDKATTVVPPTLARSVDDLVTRALVRLGEVGFGQASEPEAATRMSDLAPEVLAELVARRVYLPITAPIPAEAFDALVTILASHASSDFGLPSDEVTLLAQRAQAAEAVLRKIVIGYQGRVTAALPGIIAELQVSRVYTFPAGASIPAEAADPLAEILAARMAGDLDVDAATRQILATEGEAARKRLIALGLPARVSAAIPAILAELYTDQVYAFPVDDQIRPDAFDGLAAICSARLAADIAPERAAILLPEAQMAEHRLRRMRAQPVSQRPIAGWYF